MPEYCRAVFSRFRCVQRRLQQWISRRHAFPVWAWSAAVQGKSQEAGGIGSLSSSNSRCSA